MMVMLTERQRIFALIDAYVDGELSPERVLEVEEWVDQDDTIRQHVSFAFAMKASARQAVRASAAPTSAFQARLQAALAADAGREARDSGALVDGDILPAPVMGSAMSSAAPQSAASLSAASLSAASQSAAIQTSDVDPLELAPLAAAQRRRGDLVRHNARSGSDRMRERLAWGAVLPLSAAAGALVAWGALSAVKVSGSVRYTGTDGEEQVASFGTADGDGTRHDSSGDRAAAELARQRAAFKARWKERLRPTAAGTIPGQPPDAELAAADVPLQRKGASAAGGDAAVPDEGGRTNTNGSGSGVGDGATDLTLAGLDVHRRVVPGDLKKPAGRSADPFRPIDDLLDEFVAYHMDPPEPEITDSDEVASLDSAVGVPVRAPRVAQLGARWAGGVVLPVPKTVQTNYGGRGVSRLPGRAAAGLAYRLGKDRVTFYVYDARRFPLRARLEPKVVRDVPVHVGRRRGASIAAVEREGVGYAVTTQLDEAETAELVTASLQ